MSNSCVAVIKVNFYKKIWRKMSEILEVETKTPTL